MLDTTALHGTVTNRSSLALSEAVVLAPGGALGDVPVLAIEGVCPLDSANDVTTEMWGFRVAGETEVTCGSPGPVLRGRVRSLTKGGRMLTCGATAGYDPKTDIRFIWTFEHNILGSNGWSMA